MRPALAPGLHHRGVVFGGEQGHPVTDPGQVRGESCPHCAGADNCDHFPSDPGTIDDHRHHAIIEAGPANAAAAIARRMTEPEQRRREPTVASTYQVTIATVAEQSADFRRVLWTGRHVQLVAMTIPAGGEIGEETHEGTDQILTFVSGTGEAVVAGQVRQVAQGDLVAVPAGTRHNFRNTGVNPLVLYTVYGPPEHADGTVHATKERADAAEEAGLANNAATTGSGSAGTNR
jgi:mannose-6-phosphate isomerase-like protein (cupin superfamily)